MSRHAEPVEATSASGLPPDGCFARFTSWLTTSRGAGLVLVLTSLGADLAFTLTGHAIPATIASITTAGIGLVTGSVLRQNGSNKI